ncbi:hypothetical protein A2U01_0091326, partial [Trifolium medium]|nr:hypothetical protein [Trifolium medium]
DIAAGNSAAEDPNL